MINNVSFSEFFGKKFTPCFLTFRSVNLDQKQVLHALHCGLSYTGENQLKLSIFACFQCRNVPAFRWNVAIYPCIDSTRNMHKFCHNFNIFKELLLRLHFRLAQGYQINSAVLPQKSIKFLNFPRKSFGYIEEHVFIRILFIWAVFDKFWVRENVFREVRFLTVLVKMHNFLRL